MKRLFLFLILVLSVSLFAKGGRVHVRAYYRKDGTFVRAHTRSMPKSHGKSIKKNSHYKTLNYRRRSTNSKKESYIPSKLETENFKQKNNSLIYEHEASFRSNPLNSNIKHLKDDNFQKRQQNIIDSKEIKVFSEEMKKRKYIEQNGICPICHCFFPYKEMESDHIFPHSKGGKTEYYNFQMLCPRCKGMKEAK